MTTASNSTIAEPLGVYMREALTLAEQSVGLSEPNPRVGCVIVGADGQVIGRGHTQVAGGPHAEVMALRQAQADHAVLRGATVYVTLEPCAHHGRTPPCCDALIAAQVGRVFMAMVDPNPQVAGQGAARLRAAGVDVMEWPEGVERHQAHELNIGFFSRMQRGLPWVRLKMALSLDGRSALLDGRSQWLTGALARTDGHVWRRRAGAVLTGVGTVLTDNPRMDVRLVSTQVQPRRVVIDAQLETPPDARILSAYLPGGGPSDHPPSLIYTALTPNTPAKQGRLDALQASGAEVVSMPELEHPGRVDLLAVLKDLAQRGVNELHLEAGHGLNGAFVRAGLVDEFVIYLAPKLVGQGHGLASIGNLPSLDQAPALRFIDVATIGDDLRLVARPQAEVMPLF